MPKGKLEKSWMVTRTDDAGNTFLVRENVSKELAEAMVEIYSERNHKQHYNMYGYTIKTKQSVLKKHRVIV